MNTIKRTPLHDELQKSSPRWVEFQNWEMPVQFDAGTLKEHEAVREAVGAFDVGHMGKLEIRGEGAEALLNRLTVNDVVALPPFKAQYTAMCDERGCPLDDMILYRFGKERFRLVVNAGNFATVFDHVARHSGTDVVVEDLADRETLIAVQGPKALETLDPLTSGDLDGIGYYGFASLAVLDVPMTVARLGYTGEDGFEIMAPVEHSPKLWAAVLEAGKPFGVLPCGLGARDTLRLEACFSLYGHELDGEHNLLESNLGWIVKLDKGDFIGRKALLEQKQKPRTTKLIALELEKGIPRQGYAIFAEGEKIGEVTSGTMSPTLRQGVGLGFVKAKAVKVGSPIVVRRKDREFPGRVVSPPFLKKK